jgi:hypothetical protein
MKPLIRFASLFALLLAGPGCGGCGEGPKVPFKPSKETTYITEPVDADGYIDYETALNERLRGTVTPETNANVLLWQALGPKPEGKEMHADYWKWLGVKPPPEEGEYFIGSREFFKQHGREEFDENFHKFEDQLTMKPWSAKDHADYVGWLKRNEKPLEIIRQALLREQYYNPKVSRTETGARGRLVQASLSNVQTLRQVADALAMRAMLKVNEAKYDSASEDLLAIHRLARMAARAESLLELLLAGSLEAEAYRGGLHLIERWNPNSPGAKRYRDELRKLSQLPDVITCLKTTERFEFLDQIQSASKYGIHTLGDFGADPPEWEISETIEKIDWQAVFRLVSKSFDRMEHIFSLKERTLRKASWEEFRKDSKESDLDLDDDADVGKIRSVISENVARLLMKLLIPDYLRIQNARDRSVQYQRNLQLAFALAAYRAEHGKYPAQLADLAPKYIDTVPLDYFSDKPLVYKPTADGYLLSSVGENGRDDGGATFTDDPSGDDLVVRMPANVDK